MGEEKLDGSGRCEAETICVSSFKTKDGSRTESKVGQVQNQEGLVFASTYSGNNENDKDDDHEQYQNQLYVGGLLTRYHPRPLGSHPHAEETA